jgi:type IV secretory pathway VirB2 component (pilin)
MKFKFEGEGKVNVTSNNATWANGISKSIEDAFAQKKLGYGTLIEDFFSKLFATIVTWFSLSLAFAYLIVRGYSHSGIVLDFDQTLVGVFGIGGLFGGLFVIYYFLTWLFPRYEFGETMQKRFRKWIWSALIGSGLVAVIVDRLISLP